MPYLGMLRCTPTCLGELEGKLAFLKSPQVCLSASHHEALTASENRVHRGHIGARCHNPRQLISKQVLPSPSPMAEELINTLTGLYDCGALPWTTAPRPPTRTGIYAMFAP
eukprot:351291-Chlamydomonas_euryale.AAC.5